ncbi:MULTISPECIES: acetolactate synthase AlsS [Paraburkholderia]|uniref:Acetolactate synthase, large subunit n=1 Tax=Paraburkholderia phenazinium TaxID=60549 RepID=A0A1N6KC67_9BURK|nr:acetolactate synthase AlsS [Paraburkholderia phenazinium]SIO54184.1 acetolactate synthase, large subunit [Paraburkholderia phenazinium]
MSSKIDNSARTGAELVVRTLEDQGVEYVFGIPGAKIDAVFNTLVDSKIRTVVCRHEQNAAFIAGGIGRMTGKAGVCIATSGPGVSNLVTGLATANSEGDPVVALGGAVATDEALKHLHQTMDSVSICKPVTKFSAAVGAPQAVAEVVSNAFRAAESGRPGAAFVSLPRDIMSAPAEGKLLVTPGFSGQGPADGAAIAEAARLINAAQTPVVLLGLLASKPANASAVRQLIAANHLPVVGTFQSAGAIAAHLLADFGGRVGQLANQPADRLLEAADLVITVGYDPVEYWPSLWNKECNRKIIHIDVLPADLDSYYCPAVELIGDIDQTLSALTLVTERKEQSPISSAILRAIREERAHLSDEAARLGGAPVHPLRIVHELQKFLDPDVTLCLDMGSFHLWFARYLYSFRSRQVLISNGQQTLGVALPWAIAATLVRPTEKVISISGDGGFLFSSMELETAVRLKSNLVHMVLIDGTYDMVAVQEIAKYGRPSGIAFGPVDPVKYAEAFGAVGLMIRTADDIASVMKTALDTPGPVIVGVHVDYRDNHKLFEMAHDSAFH